MLQAWIMRGLRASQEADEARAKGSRTATHHHDRLMAILDEAGFTSVVATNCDQHYVRPLVLGDHLEVSSVIDSVSSEKTTGLGVGHFITTRLEFTDQDGEPVATMLFRILKFKPRPKAGRGQPHVGTGASSSGPRHRSAPSAPARPHPGQPVLLRGGKGAQAPHPAVHQLRDPPAPASALVRPLPFVRVGHGRPHRVGAPSTASWSTTTLRCRRSTTRWWWPWSSSRRAPGWWPMWATSRPTACPSGCR